MRRLACLVAAMTLAACTVGPDYDAPKGEVPAAFVNAPPAGADVDIAKWWTGFGDPVLDRLVDQALAGNLDLRAAASRIRQARAATTEAAAAGLPSVTASGNALDLRTHSRSIPLPGGSGGDTDSQARTLTTPSHLSFYSAGFDASWELDVFGGVRRGVEAARAQAEAAVWQARDAQVSLSAEVVGDYTRYRAAQAQLALLQAAVKTQAQTLGIARDRARAGFTTELDVNQANTQYEATRAQIPAVQAQMATTARALSVLAGQPADALAASLAPAGPVPAWPQALPAGLPSELLLRRPDIRVAERQLAAATAQVGVATAALYPKFNLLGLASLGAPHLSDLLDSDNGTAVALGMIQWPLFSAGRLRAGVTVAQEQRAQAYLAYQKAVLRAVADVEDALDRYAAEREHNASLRRSLASAQSSATIAADQYRSGLANALNLLSSQAAALTMQGQLAQSDAALAADLAALCKALGGGWSADHPAR
jgi:NodT family efflux transporter outer membrane factor (OMF) lipoprotein